MDETLKIKPVDIDTPRPRLLLEDDLVQGFLKQIFFVQFEDLKVVALLASRVPILGDGLVSSFLSLRCGNNT
jgi:hypothetical protein